jgi:hypothetical protein
MVLCFLRLLLELLKTVRPNHSIHHRSSIAGRLTVIEEDNQIVQLKDGEPWSIFIFYPIKKLEKVMHPLLHSSSTICVHAFCKLQRNYTKNEYFQLENSIVAHLTPIVNDSKHNVAALGVYIVMINDTSNVAVP